MRRLVVLFLLIAAVGGCTGYRQDATHRSGPSAGAAVSSTGPTADPDAYSSALPRAVIRMGTRSRGNLPALGVLTGAVLVVAMGLGVYTIRLVYRRPPR